MAAETPGYAAPLGRIVSGLSILTLSGEDGFETGMLASWVQQCSFDPPRVSVAVKSDRPLLTRLGEGAAFVLNLIPENRSDLVKHFGKGFDAHEPAFVGLDVDRTPASGPVLLAALGWLGCRVVSRTPAGDHELLVADIGEGKLLLADGKPWVHIRKSGLHY